MHEIHSNSRPTVTRHAFVHYRAILMSIPEDSCKKTWEDVGNNRNIELEAVKRKLYIASIIQFVSSDTPRRREKIALVYAVSCEVQI